jgi:uncharacterized protein YfbU (UPF0304 family)
MTLTVVERWILSNQFDILEALYPGKKYFRGLGQVMWDGYEAEYEEACPVEREPLSPRRCQEVRLILDLYTLVQETHRRLPDKDGIDAERLVFPGLQKHKETREWRYANYCVEHDPWSYHDLVSAPDLESRRCMLPLYRRMLAEWKKCRDPFQITREDLVRITSVRVEDEPAADETGPKSEPPQCGWDGATAM